MTTSVLSVLAAFGRWAASVTAKIVAPNRSTTLGNIKRSAMVAVLQISGRRSVAESLSSCGKCINADLLDRGISIASLIMRQQVPKILKEFLERV
jgi:hypothetical protein